MITEPYPAVIMPSGSGRMDLSDDSYTFHHYRAYGVLDNGDNEAIDLLKLIEPAHRQYLYAIFTNQLGLHTHSTKEIKIRGTKWCIVNYQQRGATKEHQDAYRAQLNALWNNRYTGILLQKVSIEGDINTRTWRKETIDESIRIEL